VNAASGGGGGGCGGGNPGEALFYIGEHAALGVQTSVPTQLQSVSVPSLSVPSSFKAATPIETLLKNMAAKAAPVFIAACSSAVVGAFVSQWAVGNSRDPSSLCLNNNGKDDNRYDGDGCSSRSSYRSAFGDVAAVLPAALASVFTISLTFAAILSLTQSIVDDAAATLEVEKVAADTSPSVTAHASLACDHRASCSAEESAKLLATQLHDTLDLVLLSRLRMRHASNLFSGQNDDGDGGDVRGCAAEVSRGQKSDVKLENLARPSSYHSPGGRRYTDLTGFCDWEDHHDDDDDGKESRRRILDEVPSKEVASNEKHAEASSLLLTKAISAVRRRNVVAAATEIRASLEAQRAVASFEKWASSLSVRSPIVPLSRDSATSSLPPGAKVALTWFTTTLVASLNSLQNNGLFGVPLERVTRTIWQQIQILCTYFFPAPSDSSSSPRRSNANSRGSNSSKTAAPPWLLSRAFGGGSGGRPMSSFSGLAAAVGDLVKAAAAQMASGVASAGGFVEPKSFVHDVWSLAVEVGLPHVRIEWRNLARRKPLLPWLLAAWAICSTSVSCWFAWAFVVRPFLFLAAAFWHQATAALF
jgi:hypothetical protein